MVLNKNQIQSLQLRKQIHMFNTYIKHKNIQKNNNSYTPDQNGKKYLVIMACHCNSQIKLQAIQKNLRYFSFENVHKILINTSDLPYNNQIRNICSRYSNTQYYEVKNKPTVDFGKWVDALELVKYNDYDYVVFINDSFIIHSSINHFLNLAAKHNVELYGYNDSTQVKYHYQSYLF